MHSKLPFSNPLDIRKCESLGAKNISDLLHPLVSYKVVIAVVLAGFAFGAQATVEKSGANAEVQGRADQYNWRWDDASKRWIVNVVPVAASSIRDNHDGDPLQSVLRSFGYKDSVDIYFNSNDAQSSVVYDSQLYGETVSTSDGTEQGPSIYSVFGFYADTDADGNGTDEPQSPDINAEMGALWLDVYDNYKSGYIFMENKGNTGESITRTDTDIQIKDDLQGTYGWGFVPGIVNIVNSGWSQPCGDGDFCGTYFANEAYPYGVDSGGITFSGIGNQSSQINVQQVLFYGDPTVPAAMSISLPWRAAGAAISLTSNGGTGGDMADFGVGGGDGGEVRMTLQDYSLNVAPHKPLATPISRDYGVFTALNAVSKGGNYGFSSVLSDRYGLQLGYQEADDKGSNGNGGNVTVSLTGVRILSCGGSKTEFCGAADSTYNTNKIIGVNAASLGGATQAFTGDKDDSNDGYVSGVGGDVTLTLGNRTLINLPFNNSVGVVATSTGDQTLLAPGTQDIYGLSDGTPGQVVVKILNGSQVLVGQKGRLASKAASGDTNIGVIANSSSNWGRELFTGQDLPHRIPGLVGDVTVVNLGSVTAYGPNAVGVLAQSIGGTSISSPSQGAKTDSDPKVPVGDTATSDISLLATGFPGSDGGDVTYTTVYVPSDGSGEQVGGSITAEGDGASGLLLQSIGGGGGAGGDSTGLFVAVGGAGGRGGNGGTLDVTLASSTVTTVGDYAKGVVGHTIGGGGGNGGFAKSFGLIFDVGVGGSGGAGGDGGGATLSATDSQISTIGQHAYGVAFQSIGGGGGTGGASSAYTVGANITFDTSVGGSGGSGGGGGDLTVTIGSSSTSDNSSVVTLGNDSHGILLQSIAGGGGAGGSAAGASYDFYAIPDVPVLNASISVGGSGGSSKPAGKLDVTNYGLIYTAGAGSSGLVMQSIGGGGGVGADSTAGANSFGVKDGTPATVNTSVSVGGSAGAGGDGGEINLTSSGTIFTRGHNAIGLLAHSIGGGGGKGGAGNAYETERWVNNVNTDKDKDKDKESSASDFNIGATAAAAGDGGGGGAGGNVTLTITPDRGSGYDIDTAVIDLQTNAVTKCSTVAAGCMRDFTTIGSGSSAIMAQSIGGSGGVGGDAGTQGINGQNVNVMIGGGGKSGGDGGAVTVSFAGNIHTGGVTKLTYTDSNNQPQTTTPVTVGGSSHGIIAQSIGGGGGAGGTADPSTSLVPSLLKKIVNWKPTDKEIAIKNEIKEWAKKESSAGVVRMLGEDSGGGDDDDSTPISYKASVSVGGSGGAAGHGGQVQISVTDPSDISIHGHHSYAILAQSVGAGGGIGASASSKSILSVDNTETSDADTVNIDFSLGGASGASGNGGDVTVNINNTWQGNQYQAPGRAGTGNWIRTGGYGSHAVFAQSVGGGGGVGHEGSIFNFSNTDKTDSSSGSSSDDDSKKHQITLGHDTEGSQAAGNGGTITVGTQDSPTVGYFETAGDGASVIFAQSIGGGGGTVSYGCTTNGKAKSTAAAQASPCFTDASPTGGESTDLTSFTADQFAPGARDVDLKFNANAGGMGGPVNVWLGGNKMSTYGDRAIAIVAQSIGGGGGYISAAAQYIGTITQSASSSLSSAGGRVAVNIGDSQVTGGTTEITTHGDGAWGVFAQSISGGGGLIGDTSLNVQHAVAQTPTATNTTTYLSAQVVIDVYDNSSIVTYGKNAHGVVMQSWSGGGGIFSGSQMRTNATLVMGEKSGGTNTRGGYSEADESNNALTLTVHSGSKIQVDGEQSIGVLAQSNVLPIDVTVIGTVQGGATSSEYVSSDGQTGIPGTGIMISGGGTQVDNQITIDKDGSLTTKDNAHYGYAIRTDFGTTNVKNEGTITGSVDLGSTPGTFTNESGGVLNKGAVYKVGNNSLHNYGTINIGQEDTVQTTNLDGRIVQYDSGRTLVTFDVLGEQSNDRLIVDGTAVLGGSFETRAKSLLPGDYEFLTATDLTVTADAADRLLYAWDVTVTDSNVTVTPTRTFRAEGLSLSPTSQNLVSYLERAWDNADAHHASLFGYKHELEAVEDYNSLLETLSGQALNAQPLQMRMSVLSNLGDSMACPVVTPNGLSLGEDRCVWAKLTGEVSDLSSSDNNLGYRSTGGGLRVGTQQTLGQGWTVGAAAGYALNDLTATNFSSNGQVFDLSLSAKRDVGQWSFGGSLGYAHGWFDNNRQVSAPDAGIASGFNRQYNSNSSLSIYSAKLRAAYTFEQDAHYIRPYVDFDVAYSQAPGFSESGQGDLALQTQSNNQWNVGISPMVEYGADFVREDKTRMLFFVSAGATFLPNNQQTTATSFVGAQAANGTFDVVTDGPNVLGRLNLGMQVYEQEGYEVRAQYGLQAGEDYWSQSVSINAVFRF